jgi:hypothetical protein
MSHWRRLVRDYEERCDFSEAMIGVALSSLMLHRIARRQHLSNGLSDKSLSPAGFQIHRQNQ